MTTYRAERRAKNLSTGELSALSGVPRSVVKAVEAFKQSYTPEQEVRIRAALGIAPEPEPAEVKAAPKRKAKD